MRMYLSYHGIIPLHLFDGFNHQSGFSHVFAELQLTDIRRISSCQVFQISKPSPLPNPGWYSLDEEKGKYPCTMVMKMYWKSLTA
jgi:hypothetical protein